MMRSGRCCLIFHSTTPRPLRRHIQIIPPQCYDFFVLPHFGFMVNAGLYFTRVQFPLYPLLYSLSLSHFCPSSKPQKGRSESSSLSFETVSLIFFTCNSPGLPDSTNLWPFIHDRLHLDRLQTSCPLF